MIGLLVLRWKCSTRDILVRATRTGGHVSHEQETRNLRSEIDYLRQKLSRKVHDRGNQTPPSSSRSEDGSYRPRSKTPLSESFSTSSHLDKVERHSNWHGENSFPKSMGNDAMRKSLRQILSHLLRRIDMVKLFHRFT